MMKGIQFEMDERFDAEARRRYMGGRWTTIHSHHYAVLYTQLADDAVDFNGIYHLTRAAEDTFYEILGRVFENQGVEALEGKIQLMEGYWASVGMGNLRFQGVGKYAVTAEMTDSHVDRGWLEKLGKSHKPINFIAQGFMAAAAALLSGKPAKSFTVYETGSIASGQSKSFFRAVLS